MIQRLHRSGALRRHLVVTVAFLLAVGLWSATRSEAATTTVEARDFAFAPPEVTVDVGDTVTWANRDAENHAVQGGPMNSPDVAPNDEFSFTFSEAGDVNYFCRIHTYMTGTVHVVTGGSPTTTTSEAPSTTTEPRSTTTTEAESTTTTEPGSTTTTTGADTTTTTPDPSTTTTAPGADEGPSFQEVEDDPSARQPPDGSGGTESPPDPGSPGLPLLPFLPPLPGLPPGLLPVLPLPGLPGATTTTGPPAGEETPPGEEPPPSGEDPPGGSGGEALGDGTVLAPFESSGGVKVFRLTMAPTTIEVAPGVTKEAYAFNGLVPGPVLRVNEGDRVRIVVDNELSFPTAVHWHGMILPNDQDGVPGVTQPAIEPGESYTYEWTAIATGTHWYHSHSSGRHIGKGLYGALEVAPRAGEIDADRDYRIMLGDTDLGFVLNGRSFPSTATLTARVGEKVRLRVINTGDQVHAMHLHGIPFDVVAQDGIRRKTIEAMDTLTISPGQTFDLVAEQQNAGKWLFHCHIFAHSHESTDHHPPGETGMNGMVMVMDVAPAAVAGLGGLVPLAAVSDYFDQGRVGLIGAFLGCALAVAAPVARLRRRSTHSPQRRGKDTTS